MATKRKPDANDEAIVAPPAPVGLVLGFGLGAIAGAACLGLEIALLGWMGVGVPSLVGLQLALGTSAVIGGLFGAAHGATGLWGGPWAIAWSLMLVGLALGTKLGAAAVLGGIPGIAGLGFALVLAFFAGQAAGRLGELHALQVGIAVAIAGGITAIGALNLHLLPTATSWFAIAVDLVCVGFATVAGAAFWAVSRGKRAPILQLVAVNAIAWLPAFPLLGGAPAPPPTAEGDRTPVVLVTIEGLRGDTLSMDTLDTPALARILRGGATFPRHQANAPWVIPSLASLHTGMLPHHHGAAMNDGSGSRMDEIGARVVTLAQVLTRDGYLSGAVVGDSLLDPYGFHRGYAWYSDTDEQGPLPTWIAGVGVAFGAAPWPVRMPAAQVTDRSVAFLEAQQGGSWLLWAHYVDASSPFLADEQDKRDNTIRPWPVDEWEASVRTLDRELGRLFEAVPDEALVIVVGTHGVELEEDRDRFGSVPASAVEGHSLYQELIGTPISIRGPRIGRATHGRGISDIDVLPTVLEYLDIEAIPRIDGLEITELRGRDFSEVFELEEKRAIVAMSVRWGLEQQSTRIGDDKIIVRADGSTPLLDLAEDDREIFFKPTDARNDGLERRLMGALPPIGAGPDHFERGGLTERLGRWLQATWNRRGGAAVESPTGD